MGSLRGVFGWIWIGCLDHAGGLEGAMSAHASEIESLAGHVRRVQAANGELGLQVDALEKNLAAMHRRAGALVLAVLEGHNADLIRTNAQAFRAAFGAPDTQS